MRKGLNSDLDLKMIWLQMQWGISHIANDDTSRLYVE